jgi:hypothetical protein
MKLKLMILPLAMATATAAWSEPVLPTFDPSAFEPGAPIDNPYFPLGSGYLRDYVGMAEGPDGKVVEERNVLVFVGAGPVLGGVQTVVVLDNAWQDGRHVEEAKDYYAQDRGGNVWYMGEDVVNFNYDDAGKMTGTDSHGSWRVGVNGALPGYAMPANPSPGLAYIQEHAPKDEAMDEGEIVALDASVSGPMGDYVDVLKVFETSSIDPDLREFKYYAEGIGMIRVEEGIDAARASFEAAADLVGLAN